MNTAPLGIQIQPTAGGVPEPLMGGTSPTGRTIGANRAFFTRDGSPWLPVMGEFHFSRYPRERWEREILKMQSGGINVIATYIFWNHIEEAEGDFNWGGNRDLRAFISLCGKHGLYAYPRIGPWAHGECRRGGFPDWLVEKCADRVRRDDPLYLEYVRRLYSEISKQLRGLLWKEGGPVIGIQVENELLDNAPHLRTLKALALECGLDVPIYTMTGWGPAQVPGDALIPVFGGYPDAFWDRDVRGWSRASRKHYFFTHLRDDNTIGADMGPRPEAGDLDYMQRFPYGTCETGGGMQVAYHRRPYIAAEDIAAIAYAKVGSGSNLQGYYMYHGGSNPMDMRSPMQESQDTAYPNDLPVVNYDFQAPLGQYGQVRESFHALRPLHLFLQSFGDRLAPLPMYLPELLPTSLDDTSTLRWSVRADGERGFLFINNYQRIEPLPDHPGVQFSVRFPGQAFSFPRQPVTIPSGFYGVWPLNMDLDGACLRFATAQPVCRIDAPGGPLYVFAAAEGIPAEFNFLRPGLERVHANAGISADETGWTVTGLRPGADCLITLETVTGTVVRLLLLSPAQACRLSLLRLWGADRLLLSGSVLYASGGELFVETPHGGGDFPVEFSMYPVPDGQAQVNGTPHAPSARRGIFTHFAWQETAAALAVHSQMMTPAQPAAPVRIGPAGVAQAPAEDAWAQAARWHIHFPEGLPGGESELLLTVDYCGDAARADVPTAGADDRLINDDFYSGRPWQIGLSEIAAQAARGGLTLRFLPLRADAPVYIAPEHLPRFGESAQALEVRGITLQGVRESKVTFVPTLIS